MPAKSKQQFKYIWAMRNKYKSKKKSPKNMKWVFNKDWTNGVKYEDLKENYIKKFKEFCIDKFI